MCKRILLLACLLLPNLAAAQFYLEENEPASVRWNQLETPAYRLVYPRGLDSMARAYAMLLEAVRAPVGAGIGVMPNQHYRTKMPVILHPYNLQSNGMVGWTPRIMSLYTTPSAEAPLPMPWAEHLVIHESRHAAQLQYANRGALKILHVLTGDLFAGAMASLYGGPSFFEGDAVLAETQLTFSGRGRSADFLSFFRMSLLTGDKRNYWRWRWGSQRYYTPDYYTLGYVTLAGIGTYWNAPDFTKRYYDRLFDRFLPLFNFQKTVRETTGLPFSRSFSALCDSLALDWRLRQAERGAPMPMWQLSPTPRFFAEDRSVACLGDCLYSVRSGMDRTAALVRTDTSGRSCRVAGLAASVGSIREDPVRGRLYWSEVRPDVRWGMKNYGEVWYWKPGQGRRRLTRGTRYYHPSASSDGNCLAVSEYPVAGGSALLVLDADAGHVLRHYEAPAGMQLVESAWIGEDIYVTGITEAGQGIYCATRGFETVVPPAYSQIRQLFPHGGRICFTGDADGQHELYAADPEAKTVEKWTETPYGATAFRFSPGADSLYYAALTPSGHLLCQTPADSLPAPQRVFPGDGDACPMAGTGAVSRRPAENAPAYADSIGSPRPYSKAAHLFRFHSWAPLFVDYDAVERLGFSSLSSVAGLGATAFFQNDLSTSSGFAAYHAYPDENGVWRHAGTVKYTYSGWYPVIEGRLTIDSSHPRQYYLHRHDPRGIALEYAGIEKFPSVSGQIRTYIPFNFSSGGWYRGVIPQLQLSLSNDMVAKGDNVPLGRMTVSARGYVSQGIPASCIYPRWGFGLEAGWSGRPGLSKLFCSNAYVSAYGYLPALARTHGIKLTVLAQQQIGDALFSESYASTLPRGFSGYAGTYQFQSSYPFQSRITWDYAFPFAPLDASFLGPLAYIRNFEATLHADYTWLRAKDASAGLYSLGADVCVRLSNLLWLPFDTRIGVSWYYNGGPSFRSCCPEASPHYVGMLFSVAI